jgi:hypothetical protein
MAPRTATKKATPKKNAPGFWDSYKDEGGGKYLTASEKNDLIDNATALPIVAVRYDEKNQFQGNPAPRYVVTFVVDGTERYAGFAISEDGDSSRDRLLGALVDYLDEDGAEKVEVVLERVGNFVALVKA